MPQRVSELKLVGGIEKPWFLCIIHSECPSTSISVCACCCLVAAISTGTRSVLCMTILSVLLAAWLCGPPPHFKVNVAAATHIKSTRKKNRLPCIQNSFVAWQGVAHKYYYFHCGTPHGNAPPQSSTRPERANGPLIPLLLLLLLPRGCSLISCPRSLRLTP